MSVAKIAISVAGGGPWMSFALDAFDTAFSVATGEMSLGDGAMSLAKGAASTVASSAISGLGDKLTGAMGEAGFGGIVSTTVSKVATSYANTYATAAINSFSFKGGFHFDKDNFRDMSKGAHLSALKSGAIAMSSSIVSGAIAKSKGATYGKDGWGFYNKVGNLSKTASKMTSAVNSISGFWGGIAGQAASAAMGDGFKLNLLNAKDLGIGDGGLLEFTIGGKNKSPFHFEIGSDGADVSSSALDALDIANDYFKVGIHEDAGAQYYLNNYKTDAGLAKITYVDFGLGSRNANAMKTSMDIINGDKSLEFANFEKGHFGHADAKNSVIQMNKDAINISSDTMSKAGFFTSVMAREGFLIDKNIESGLQNVSKLDSETAHEFTMDAFQMQSGVLNDIAKNMGIKLDGGYGALANEVKRIAETGDLQGWNVTGRDASRSIYYSDLSMSKDARKDLIKDGLLAKSSDIMKRISDGKEGSIKFADKKSQLRANADGTIDMVFANGKTINLNNKQKYFKRMYDGAKKGGFDAYEDVEDFKSLDSLHSKVVKEYYDEFDADGHMDAVDKYGGNSFSYINTKQIRLSDNISAPNGFYYKAHRKTVRNMQEFKDYTRDMDDKKVKDPYNWRANNPYNCTVSSSINDLKSEGILPADMTVTEAYRKYGNKIQNMETIMQNLKGEDWAKLTGVSDRNYKYVEVSKDGMEHLLDLNKTVIYLQDGIADFGVKNVNLEYHYLNIVGNIGSWYKLDDPLEYEVLGKYWGVTPLTSGARFYKNLDTSLFNSFRKKGWIK